MPDPDSPATITNSPGSIAERDAAQAALPVGVAIADVVQREHGHGSIPRRSANGSRASATTSAASDHAPGPSGACTSG